MIKYDGIVNRGKVLYIVFKNERGVIAEVPVDEKTAIRITQYLEKIATDQPMVAEIGNDEPTI